MNEIQRTTALHFSDWLGTGVGSSSSLISVPLLFLQDPDQRGLQRVEGGGLCSSSLPAVPVRLSAPRLLEEGEQSPKLSAQSLHLRASPGECLPRGIWPWEFLGSWQEDRDPVLFIARAANLPFGHDGTLGNWVSQPWQLSDRWASAPRISQPAVWELPRCSPRSM